MCISFIHVDEKRRGKQCWGRFSLYGPDVYTRVEIQESSEFFEVDQEVRKFNVGKKLVDHHIISILKNWRAKKKKEKELIALSNAKENVEIFFWSQS